MESEPRNANATPMDVDGVGKGRGKGKERQRIPRLTRTLQPSLKASVAIVPRTVMSGQTAGSDSACEEHTCPWNFAEG